MYVAKGAALMFSKRPREHVGVPLFSPFALVILAKYWKIAIPGKRVFWFLVFFFFFFGFLNESKIQSDQLTQFSDGSVDTGRCWGYFRGDGYSGRLRG